MVRRIVLLIMYLHLCYSSTKKQVKFEVYLEHIQVCKKPNPPYAKRVNIIPKYEIRVVNGKRFLSGNSTIIEPTAFLNFSARSYSIDSLGRRVVRFQISEVSCKNLIAKSLIMLANVPISTRNCLLHKGFYSYENMDLNKISHALPGWYMPGRLIHEMQLVRQGAKVTEFCNEVKVLIKNPRKINN